MFRKLQRPRILPYGTSRIQSSVRPTSVLDRLRDDWNYLDHIREENETSMTSMHLGSGYICFCYQEIVMAPLAQLECMKVCEASVSTIGLLHGLRTGRVPI